MCGESVQARLLHRVNAPGWVEECLVVTEGGVEAGPTNAPTNLAPGDSIHVDAAQPHLCRGAGR